MENSFGYRLKLIRKERKMTQESLAANSKVCVSNIKRYEQARFAEPSAFHLLALAHALSVSPEYLLNGDENMRAYTNCIKKELCQIRDFQTLQSISAMDLDGTVLSHLELSDDLVDEIRYTWLDNQLFRDEDGKLHDCTRPYTRGIILRYCQNRSRLKTDRLVEKNVQ